MTKINDVIHTESHGHTRKTCIKQTSLIHWGRSKMAAIFQTTWWNAFSWINICESLYLVTRFAPSLWNTNTWLFLLHWDEKQSILMSWYIRRCCLSWSKPLTSTKIKHKNEVIMSAMASQITSLMIVYSAANWKRRSKKTSKLLVTGLREGNSPVTGEFPAQRASNAKNVSIWWRHHSHRL